MIALVVAFYLVGVLVHGAKVASPLKDNLEEVIIEHSFNGFDVRYFDLFSKKFIYIIF